MTETPDDANRQFDDREGPAAQWFIAALAAFLDVDIIPATDVNVRVQRCPCVPVAE
jgi:hypothetical protein